MLSGPGFSKERPNPEDSGYLHAALEQTPLELVRSYTMLLPEVRESLRGRGVTFHGFQRERFLETTVLAYLGIESSALSEQTKLAPPSPRNSRLLLFAQNSDGHVYPSIGDIVGASGHSVAVVSPDELHRQRQDTANPNITYHRSSMGALTMQDVEPGFDVALISGDQDPIGHGDAGPDEQGEWVRYRSADRIRGVLEVMRPTGRIILTETADIEGFFQTVKQQEDLAADLHGAYDLAYLRTYDDNGHHCYATPPYLILEKHE